MIITSRADAGQPQQPAEATGWQSTRAQTSIATQFIDDEDQYLGDGRREIGRPVVAPDGAVRPSAQSDRELFVSCAPGEALQQQFEHWRPEFIAVHDIATGTSRQLVAGLAAASKRSVQKLFIRRQGFGTALATLCFVDVPNVDGGSVRIFSTDAETEPAERAAVARALLAFSQLGVLMVGDMPQQALAEHFDRWHGEMVHGAWPNRSLLLLPLAAANALASHGLELARGTPVQVRTTPKVSRATDAWGFIESTWTRMRRERGPAGPPVVSRPMPLGLKPMPEVSSRLDPAAGGTPDAALERYVAQVGELAGMVSCCVFEVASGREVMHAGADPWQVELARHGTDLLAAMSATARALGLGRALPEAAITLEGHHLLLRGVPGRPGLALHAVLDSTQGNLTLTRLRLERLDVLTG